GKQYSEFDDRESLSAIICLHSPLPQYRDFDYQVPVFFRTSDEKQKETGESCRDAVQVGPRILEDPTVGEQRGITQAEKSSRSQQRVIFAVDDPGRRFPPNKRKENARNAYIIVTSSLVHLWDVQEMLMSPDFYGSGSKPHWAVNMAGGGPSGMIVRGEANNDAIIRGNPSGIIGSAFVVTKRAK
ncbi:MAG: hypothetical protein WBW81_08985, partial [Methylocella sp.]